MTRGSEARLLVDAAADVDALTEAPLLTALVEETGARPPRPGQIGLAVRRDASGVLWFLLAGDEATYADLDALARAFVWPSFARARVPSAYLQDGDPIADAIQARAPGGMVVLLSPPERASSSARAITLMLETRRRRPEGAIVAPRHIGRVLRDFEDAVARSDAGSAKHLLDEAWSTGRLSLVNRSFLQARLLAAERRWSEVLDHSARHRLPDLDLPHPVEHDLVRAIYWALLHEILEERDVSAAIEAFRDGAQPAFGDVFRDHRAAASSEARRAWMIRWAALDSEWPAAARDELLQQAANADERRELESMAKHVRFSTAASQEFARQLLDAREDAAAFALADSGPQLPEGERATILVQAAARLSDVSRLASAAEAIEAAGGVAEVQAPAHLVERLATHPRPALTVDSWPRWLKAVYDDPNWPDAVKVVDEQAEAWEEILAQRGDSLDEVAELVEALAGEEVFRIALPRFVRAVVPEGQARSELVRSRSRTLHALAYAISQDPASGVADLEALTDILAALLEAGLSSERFDQLSVQITLTWSHVGGAPRLARWIVDITRVLVSYPCPDEPRRIELLGSLIAPLVSDATRSQPLVPREVWLEITELLESTGLEELVPDAVRERTREIDDDERDDFSYLAGQTVLIHTLVPGAAERAGDYLRSLVPTVRVWPDESHVGGAQLRDRTRQAQCIVIASRACKHAASDFIRDHAAVDIRWASGKGWSSLVDALRSSPALA